MAKNTEFEKVTYLLTMQDGTKQKISCPKDWTITFGPLCPGSKEHNGSRQLALRLRDGQNQKAVFTNVESFRDMSMQVEIEVVDTQYEQFSKKDENGQEKHFVAEARVKKWVDPEKPNTEIKPVQSKIAPMLEADNKVRR